MANQRNKTSKETKESLEDWLISLQKPIGKSIVITLLITRDGSVHFMHMTDYRVYAERFDDEEEVPSSNKLSLNKDLINTTKLNYLG